MIAKDVEPEIMKSVHGISLEAALLIDRLNKFQFYNQHESDFKEFLAVDLADLLYYVNILTSALNLTNEELQEISDLKLAHFYKQPRSNSKFTVELFKKYNGIFSKYKHNKPY